MSKSTDVTLTRRKWPFPYPNWGMVALLYLVSMGLLQYLDSIDLFNGYYLHILTIIGMNIILVASLNLVNGYMGEFALGHAGFMGIGAYTAAVLVARLGLPFYLGLIGGMFAAGLIGYLVGLLTFKTIGDYLAIITLGFNAIIVNAIQNIDYLGGPRGFTNIPLGTNLFTVAVCVVFTYFVLRNLVNSNYGRIWVSIRENTIAAELMGVNINRAKNIAFTVAAAFAGLAGALWAQLQQYIDPNSFYIGKTTDILVMLYLGGMGSLSGSILGVVAYTVLMEILRFIPVVSEWRMAISPLILVVIMLTRQFGLMGNKEWRWMRPGKEAGLQ